MKNKTKYLFLGLSLVSLLVACETSKSNFSEQTSGSSEIASSQSSSGSQNDSSSAQTSKSKSSSSKSLPEVSTSFVGAEQEVLTCGHHQEMAVKTPATCEQKGYTTHVCLECGEFTKDSYVDEITHDYSYEYLVSSGDGQYEVRKMCTHCGSTLKGDKYRLVSNKVRLDSVEYQTSKPVGYVVAFDGNIKAYPALGFEFDRWSTGQTSDTITSDDSAIAYFKFKETEFPIVSIDLVSKTLDNVKRDNYEQAYVTTIDGDSRVRLDCEFKGRGNGSWVANRGKSGYTFKLENKMQILGMSAKAKKWNLIACKDDESMHINKTVYDLARYYLPDIEWEPETKFVQFYVNGEYRGVYLLTDPVKVEKSRLNIVSEDSNGNYEYTHPDAGFLIEYDRYATSNSSDFPYDPAGDPTPIEGMSYFKVDGLYREFSVKYPDVDNAVTYGGNIDDALHRGSVSNIKQTIAAISEVLNHGTYDEFANLVDMESFMDMYLLHEIFKNSDVGWSSFFLYKKPYENKVFFGPAWDFDLSAYKAKEQDRDTSGAHISTKTLNGDPFKNTTSGYNDIFVKAVQLKDGFGEKRLARELKNRLLEFSNYFYYGIFENVNGSDINNLAFAMNTKKWTVNGYALNLSKLMMWLVDRMKWMINNDFVI